MNDALEMAVLSSVTHPSIVQVFSCLTDMVEVEGARASRGQGGLDRGLPCIPRATPLIISGFARGF
jgi:hypothetical protein